MVHNIFLAGGGELGSLVMEWLTVDGFNFQYFYIVYIVRGALGVSQPFGLSQSPEHLLFGISEVEAIVSQTLVILMLICFVRAAAASDTFRHHTTPVVVGEFEQCGFCLSRCVPTQAQCVTLKTPMAQLVASVQMFRWAVICCFCLFSSTKADSWYLCGVLPGQTLMIGRERQDQGSQAVL